MRPRGRRRPVSSNARSGHYFSSAAAAGFNGPRVESYVRMQCTTCSTACSTACTRRRHSRINCFTAARAVLARSMCVTLQCCMRCAPAEPRRPAGHKRSGDCSEAASTCGVAAGDAGDHHRDVVLVVAQHVANDLQTRRAGGCCALRFPLLSLRVLVLVV